MNPRHIELLDRYLDGALSPEGAAELETWLAGSDEARAEFWNCVRLHSALRAVAQERRGERLARESQPRVAPAAWRPVKIVGMPVRERAGSRVQRPQARVREIPRRSWWIPLAAAAAVAIAALAVWKNFLPSQNNSTAPIAVLTRAADAVWADDAFAPQPGHTLPEGWLRLKSGAVQVEFSRGARVIVEGPAEFRLVSAQEGFLGTGRLTAHVPAQARGFKIGSTALTVVDLGTDFGVTVPASGPAEVHVFSGKVEVALNSQSTAARAVVGGEAVRLETGSLRDFPANRAAFLGEAELVERDLASARHLNRSLSADSATIVHFTFDKPSDDGRVLRNQAANAPAETHGSIVGCEWVEGRLPGKRALAFRGEGDRVRLNVATPLPAVTLLVWLRVEGLPHSTHALFNADSERPGALRWELTGGGKLRLGVARPSSRPEANWEALNSPVVASPERLGQWLMLASVFDGKRISHYADGKLVASAQAAGPSPMILKTVELGNWAGTPSRGFQGRIDEFALLARALTVEEVRALYESGRPDAPANHKAP